MSNELRDAIDRAFEQAGHGDAATDRDPPPEPEKVEEPEGTEEKVEEPEGEEAEGDGTEEAGGEVEKTEEEGGEAEGDGTEETEEAGGEAQDDAPTRFNPVARADWAKAPASVRREVQRMERELTQGIEQHRQRVADIEPYEQMAKEAGRKLPDVIASYVGMERMLRTDPVTGFQALAEQLGYKPADVAAMLTNEKAAQPQRQPQQPTQDVSRLREELGEVRNDLKVRDKVAEIERWAKAPGHERFQEAGIAQDMAKFLETGVVADLDAAYDMACRLRPPKAAAQPKPKPVDKPVEGGDKKAAKPKPQPQGRPSAKATQTRKASDDVGTAVERALQDVGLFE